MSKQSCFLDSVFFRDHRLDDFVFDTSYTCWLYPELGTYVSRFCLIPSWRDYVCQSQEAVTCCYAAILNPDSRVSSQCSADYCSAEFCVS